MNTATTSTIVPFKRHIHVANIKTRRGATVHCFVTVEWRDDGELSICGVEGPRSDGDSYGSCGQTSDMKRWASVGPDIEKLRTIWKAYHLNNMRAGTPAQTAALEEFFRTRSYPLNQYEFQVAYLKDQGLEPDNGHHYGTAWLKSDVPAEMIEWLRDLKGGTAVYPWND